MLSVAFLLAPLTALAQPSTSDASQGSAPVYEIRNYHVDLDRFDDYKNWIRTHALPHLRQELDLVGFWVDTGIEASVSGVPLDSLGPANVTWIIRWTSKVARDEKMGEIFTTPEFEEIFSRLPGEGTLFHRVEKRFFEAF